MLEIIKFDLQLFGGGGTQVINEPARVPDMSPEEKQLLNEQLKYVQYISPSAYKLADLGMQGIMANQVNPNYPALYADMKNRLSSVQSNFDMLQQGIIPEEFKKNQEQYIRSGVNSTVGTAVNDLAGKGILNSSVTQKAMGDIGKGVSDTIAQNYNNNISTLSGLYEQGQQMAFAPIQYGAAAQSAAIDAPSKYFAMATGQNAPNNDAWKTMMGNRYSLKSDPTAIVDQGWGGAAAQVLGGWASSGFKTFCFLAGTPVSTPDGEIPIEELKPGDKVLSFDSIGIMDSEVNSVNKYTVDDYYQLESDGVSVYVAGKHPFLTQRGFVQVKDLTKDDKLVRYSNKKVYATPIENIVLIPEQAEVYNLTVDANSYFAHGFAVEGDE